LEYTVTVNRESNPLSNVATLSNLTVSSGSLTPAFNSSTYVYTVNVPYNVSSITLTATPTDLNATVVGAGVKNLAVSVNVFVISVTAQDGITVQNYTVTVNRALNTVATLSNLTVSSGTLTPVFNSSTYTYSVDVPYSVNIITLTATSTDPNAIITGGGIKTLNIGANIFTITVTAQDGVTILDYTVTINRENAPLSSVATLSNLAVSSGTLTPAFNSSTYVYTVNVPYNVSSITLTATPSDPNATVVGAGVNNLSVGANVCVITVTAQDGVTVQNYTVIVNRALNNDATLSTLSILEGELTPIFNSNIYNYSVDIIEDITEITIAAIPSDPMAQIFGAGLKDLNSGANFFTLIVVAEDGLSSLEYHIAVNRVVGIPEPKNSESKLLVYPNPTTGELRITASTSSAASGLLSEVELYDIYGRKILLPTCPLANSSTANIDISHLPAGVYFVRVGAEVERIIKK
jgi:hypothetical protein